MGAKTEFRVIMPYVWWLDTNVSEDRAASIFMKAIIDIQPPHYTAQQPRKAHNQS
jgi:hypothetical protein